MSNIINIPHVMEEYVDENKNLLIVLMAIIKKKYPNLKTNYKRDNKEELENYISIISPCICYATLEGKDFSTKIWANFVKNKFYVKSCNDKDKDIQIIEIELTDPLENAKQIGNLISKNDNKEKISITVCSITGKKANFEVKSDILLSEFKKKIAIFVGFQPHEQRITCFPIIGEPKVLLSNFDDKSLNELNVHHNYKICVVWKAPACHHPH